MRIELPGTNDVKALLALMRCHLAFAQSRGFSEAAAACPLYIRGLQIRESTDGRAIEIVGTPDRLADEIRRRSRQTLMF